MREGNWRKNPSMMECSATEGGGEKKSYSDITAHSGHPAVLLSALVSPAFPHPYLPLRSSVVLTNGLIYGLKTPLLKAPLGDFER